MKVHDRQVWQVLNDVKNVNSKPYLTSIEVIDLNPCTLLHNHTPQCHGFNSPEEVQNVALTLTQQTPQSPICNQLFVLDINFENFAILMQL
jgi:hypothetical protein